MDAFRCHLGNIVMRMETILTTDSIEISIGSALFHPECNVLIANNVSNRQMLAMHFNFI